MGSPLFRYTQVLSDRYVLAYANRRDLDRIRELLGTNFYRSRPMVMGLLDREALDAAGIRQVQEQSYLSLTGRGVLIGLVDTGIDYTNTAFIYEDGTTKIASIYDMSDNSGPPPEGFSSAPSIRASRLTRRCVPATHTASCRSAIPRVTALSLRL